LHCLAGFTELKILGSEHPSSPAKPNIVGGKHFSSSSSQSSADEDFALEEDFTVLLLDFELSFLLLLDTGSSESALLPLSSPQAARRKTQDKIARPFDRHFGRLSVPLRDLFITLIFFIKSSPRNKLKHLV
jgi:hypothetical protein